MVGLYIIMAKIVYVWKFDVSIHYLQQMCKNNYFQFQITQDIETDANTNFEDVMKIAAGKDDHFRYSI